MKMSSPLALLKKKKRAHLDASRERQTVPFRRNLLKEVTADLESSDLHPPLAPRASHASSSASHIPPEKGAPPSNMELLSAMMKRVTLLETVVRGQAKEIGIKDEKISALERKLQPLASTGDVCDRSALERRCEQLQNQVWEMESFLKDYDLTWVGDDAGLNSPGDSPTFAVNFDLVLKRIEDLNVVAGEGENFVRSTATGAHFATKDSVQLSLYRDGMVMFDGPFRSYQEPSTQQFLQDLMDGYFPSELQSRFPDGIPFKVHDRRNQEFLSRVTCPGERQAGGPAKVTASLGKRVTVDQFLNRLPKVVVKDGHVIDIRSSLRETLQGPFKTQSSRLVIVDTPALHVDKERVNSASPDLITLKIRSEDGDHTFILKMRFSETIGNVRRYLDKHRGSGLSGYDIISLHPWCCYSDESQTLGCCGFTGNTALLLQRSK